MVHINHHFSTRPVLSCIIGHIFHLSIDFTADCTVCWFLYCMHIFYLFIEEPCKRQMKHFKKKYGADGHLHFNAPQCTPLWLYAPVQVKPINN